MGRGPSGSACEPEVRLRRGIRDSRVRACERAAAFGRQIVSTSKAHPRGSQRGRLIAAQGDFNGATAATPRTQGVAARLGLRLQSARTVEALQARGAKDYVPSVLASARSSSENAQGNGNDPHREICGDPDQRKADRQLFAHGSAARSGAGLSDQAKGVNRPLLVGRRLLSWHPGTRTQFNAR